MSYPANYFIEKIGSLVGTQLKGEGSILGNSIEYLKFFDKSKDRVFFLFGP